ncbi:MAG: major capsid protein [Eubacteriales bacterium]
MAFETDLFKTETLVSIADRAPEPSCFLIDTFFPQTLCFDTERILFEFAESDRQLAPFVHPKKGGEIMENESYQVESYVAPMLAPERVTDVDSIMTKRFGETPYGGMSPKERAAKKLIDDYAALKSMIKRREEWMAREVLLTGQIEIIGKGVSEVIDFGLSNNETIVAEADKWSSPSANPLADLQRWYTKVQQTGHINPNVCIMSQDVMQKFIENEFVQKVFDKSAYDFAVFKPREINSCVTYVGTYRLLNIDFYTYNEWYKDNFTDPTKSEDKPMIPDGKVILLSSNAKYHRCYGGIPVGDKTAKVPTIDIIAKPIVPVTRFVEDPPTRFLKLKSRPLPVPSLKDSWFVGTVM